MKHQTKPIPHYSSAPIWPVLLLIAFLMCLVLGCSSVKVEPASSTVSRSSRVVEPTTTSTTTYRIKVPSGPTASPLVPSLTNHPTPGKPQ